MRCYFLPIPLSLKEQEHNKEKELENALDEMKRINDKIEVAYRLWYRINDADPSMKKQSIDLRGVAPHDTFWISTQWVENRSGSQDRKFLPSG